VLRGCQDSKGVPVDLPAAADDHCHTSCLTAVAEEWHETTDVRESQSKEISDA